MDVRPNVTPSTATTSRVEARKIFAVSPNAGLVALESGIGGIVASVLVAVRLPMVAARVQRDLQRGIVTCGHVPHDLRWNALVPHVQPISTWRHVVDREAAVGPGLRVVPVRHDLHVSDHARMDVAVDAHESRIRERMALGFAAAFPSRYSTASPRSGDGLLSFSRITILPVTCAPRVAAPWTALSISRSVSGERCI